jgi:DNA mismatch endonuclease (patch repair protein)
VQPDNDKEGKRKSPRFAFSKISASTHCTHLQSRTIQPKAQALQKSAILPKHLKNTNNMTDVHDKKTRSFNMSQIKGKDTKPEMLVRKFLFSNGIRYKLHDKKLPGKPDLVFPKYKKIVFIHGCFWHGHEGCKYFVIPKTRTEWWLNKINRNKDKDAESIMELKKRGWGIISIWECELKPDKRENKLKALIKNLKRTHE